MKHTKQNSAATGGNPKPQKGNSAPNGGITKGKKPKKFIPKPSGLIKDDMKGKVFGSLSALGAFFGIKPEEPEAAHGKSCRKCGGQMRYIPGSNVWVCGNPLKDGKGICNNRIITRNIA